jgi:hypothetical protein
MRPEGPATGHLDTTAEMFPKFPVATAHFSCSPPSLTSSKLKLLALQITKLLFHVMELSINQMKIRLPMSTLILDTH